MKNKMIHYTAAALVVVTMGCAKKEEAKPAEPKAAVETTTPSPAPAKTETPPIDNTPFVIPPSAKKQAKYFPEGSPTRAIQDLDDMLDSYILEPKSPEDRVYNEKLKRAVINGTFDVRELCKLALDKHWGERSTQEQDFFVDLMMRLLEKKAIFSKEQGQKKKKSKAVYEVTYTGHKFTNADESSSLAMSHVNIPSQALKIELNYKLKKIAKGTSSNWMIYDVVVDGASLLDNYKYQFDKIIDKEGYTNLVHRMESKLKDLQSKDSTEETATP